MYTFIYTYRRHVAGYSILHLKWTFRQTDWGRRTKQSKRSQSFVPQMLCLMRYTVMIWFQRDFNQREFQDPRMQVLYHTRPYILMEYDIPLQQRPYTGLIYGGYHQFRFQKRRLIYHVSGHQELPEFP